MSEVTAQNFTKFLSDLGGLSAVLKQQSALRSFNSLRNASAQNEVSWSLTSPISTNMAISDTKGGELSLPSEGRPVIY